MISIYTSAFNLLKNKFDYKFTINQFAEFATEIVVCINTSDDNTLEAILELKSIYNNLYVIESHFDYDDPLLDGKIKNTALQATTMPVKLGLDMDEYVPLWQKNMWDHLAKQLLEDNCETYMIPSINLYKDWDHYFSITPKWYLHKRGLFRGPVNFARKPNGTIDTSRSDSCELIDVYGNLVMAKTTTTNINDLRTLSYPYVIHTGYLSLENRLLRNSNFWQKHWLVESGGEPPLHKIHTDMSDFTETTEAHRLKL
jgi:hypothetical protein